MTPSRTLRRAEPSLSKSCVNPMRAHALPHRRCFRSLQTEEWILESVSKGLYVVRRANRSGTSLFNLVTGQWQPEQIYWHAIHPSMPPSISKIRYGHGS